MTSFVRRPSFEVIRIASIVLFMVLIAGCTDTNGRRTSDDGRETDDGRRTSDVTFWTFWSEPSQRRALDSLVSVFEKAHPEINIETTYLSWSDGKAKLQMAFNAGTQPDVVHLGLDWFAEFDEGGVFASLPDSLATDGRACRWMVNVRALVVSSSRTPQRYGIAVSDPHNVVKRSIPLLWRLGSPLYSRLPLSQDLNDSLVDVLWRFTTMYPDRILDRSRQLDELLLNGKINAVLTGPWIIDMMRARNLTNFGVVPMPSILNADVLSVSASSQHQQSTHAFIAFLRDYAQARAFAVAVSDAGFPADVERARRDSIFTTDVMKKGFLETAVLSRPLPHSTKMLSIEPVIEEMLTTCFMAKDRSTIVRAVADARTKVAALESR